VADYEVFISFKNTESDGSPSRDVVMAEKLYRDLKERGIKVFFSKYSIDESARADYVDAIDEALESALLLVAVGTSKKNLTSKWVKSEINQFRTLVNSDVEGKRSIASYRSQDYPESELPSGIKSYQSFVDRAALVRFIEVFLGKDSAFQKNNEVTGLLYSSPQYSPNGIDEGLVHNNFSDSIYGKRGHKDGSYLQIGDVLDHTYRILAKVGQGGMSNVYLALHVRTNRQYAVKEIRGNGVRHFDVIVAGLRKEADMLKKMNHPAIPRIIDIIDNQDSIILVSEFVEGESLNKRLSEHGPLCEADVLDIARQLCRVFTYLHTLAPPVIYRDMKPANIIIKPDGKVMLIDFGTAREYVESKIEDTTCLGTMGYAAPEQFGGKGQTDARTDIYNLGVTLYHLVTGKNPAEPPYEILPIRTVNSDLSRGLELIIQKCTQKNPDERFQSAGELEEALNHISKFSRQEILRAFFHRKSVSDRRKQTKSVIQKQPAPPMPLLAKPEREESLFETTVLSPDPMEPSVENVSQPVKPVPLPCDSDEELFGSCPTEPLPCPNMPASSALPVSPPIVAVPVPEKPISDSMPAHVVPEGTDPELASVIEKWNALDPESKRIIGELIDRLSH